MTLMAGQNSRSREFRGYLKREVVMSCGKTFVGSRRYMSRIVLEHVKTADHECEEVSRRWVKPETPRPEPEHNKQRRSHKRKS